MVLIGIGVYFFLRGVQEEFYHAPRLAFAEVFSFGLDRLCVEFVMAELRANAHHIHVSPPQGEEKQWYVEATFAQEKAREAFAHKMEVFFRFLPYIGFYGERERDGREDEYRLFFHGQPWFLLRGKLRAPFQVALVIDDLGYSLEMARKFVDLPIKLNAAVIPKLPWSERVALLAHERGKEVLIHLPMEALNGQENLREQFLLRRGASQEEVRKLLETAIAAVPHAKGISNHKGSRATSDEKLMEAFLEYVSGKELYFLDSLTAPSSVAYQVAKRVGVKAFRRDIFLDTYSSSEYVTHQLYRAVRLAKNQGYAIAIGHAREATYQALERFVKNFSDPEVEFLFLSEIETEEKE